MNSNDPEICFHRALVKGKTFSKAGKLDLYTLPQDFQECCISLRDQSNSVLREIETKYVAPHGAPNLYFDFINSEEVNALAFIDGSWSFIGFTKGYLLQTISYCRTIAADNNFRDWLGIVQRNDVDESDSLSICLFRIITAFVFAHELGHHVYGHFSAPQSSDVIIYKEFGALGNGNQNLGSQALEIDADQHGIHSTLNHINLDPAAYLLKGIDSSAQNVYIPRLIMGAIYTFFAGSWPLDTRYHSVFNPTHPSPLVRFDFIIGAIRSWIQNHSVRWDLDSALKDIHLLTERVDTIFKSKGQSYGAYEQADSLSDNEWDEYIKKLTAQREDLRTTNKPREWTVLPS